jgi:F0F1-type ATP synthase assembly protein I
VIPTNDDEGSKAALRTCEQNPIGGGNILEVQTVRTILRFTVTGIVSGLFMGWLLSLVSGNYYVTLAVGLLGLLVGVILGVVHRNDP